MRRISSEAGARGIVEMLQGKVEKESGKLLRKWSLSPVRSGPGQSARAQAEDKRVAIEMNQVIERRQDNG